MVQVVFWVNVVLLWVKAVSLEACGVRHHLVFAVVECCNIDEQWKGFAFELII